MFEEISDFFTTDIIYLWLNLGVIPFWFMLIFFPQSKICRFFVTSIFPYLIFGAVFIHLLYILYKSEYAFLQSFNLYLGFNELVNLFSDPSFTLLFWVHFLSINLFCGSWIVKDSQKLLISKHLVFLPLIFTYFVGPVGILIYWIIRIFFAKKISLYD